jgi:DNA invertase Pin-like site-specific DNA recombinase
VKAKAAKRTDQRDEPQPTPPRAYSYLRFSTPEQSTGDSRRRQTELAEKYAQAHELDLDTQLTFADLGVSAFSGANLAGQLGAFLSAVQSKLVKPGSYLLVENLDRVSRQGFWDALPTIQAIINAGIVLVTLTDERRYDLEAVRRDPMAIMSLCFGLIRAGEESSLKARRVGEAWAAKRAKAATTPLTARVPGWLALDKARGKILPIPERVRVVRRIFQMTLKGVGQDSIARHLNATHVPTFGRAKTWQRSYIVKITTNPAVIGVLVPHIKRKQEGGKRKPLDPLPGYYPAVIEKGVFNRVQGMLRTRTPLRGRHASNGVVRNLFSGLARCPKCGGTFTRVYKGKGPKGGAYLACVLAKTGGGCTYHAVRYESVEAAFLRDADRVLNEVPAGQPGDIDAKVEEAESAALYLEDQRENLLDAIQTGGGSSALSERLKAVEKEIIELRKDHEELLIQQADAAGPLVARKVSDLHSVLRRKPLDRAAANALLRQLFSGMVVVYTGETRTLTLRWKQGGESVVAYGMEPAWAL